MKLQQILLAAALMAKVSAVYTVYKGDGSAGAGWPSIEQWISFDDLWTANQQVLSDGCNPFSVPNNSPTEVNNLKSDILNLAKEANLDPRFVLVIMTQESNGCLRVQTTTSSDGTVRNPGPLQTHNGDHTCNIKDDLRAEEMKKLWPAVTWTNGVAVDCPANMIEGMIRDGIFGTKVGDGLKQVTAQAVGGPVANKRQVVGSPAATVAIPAALSTCDAVAMAQFSDEVWQNAVLQMQLAYAGSPLTPSSIALPDTGTDSTSSSPESASSDTSALVVDPSTPVPTTLSTAIIPATASPLRPSFTEPSSPSSSSSDTTSPSIGQYPAAKTYYRASRLYNSGSILDNTKLGNGASSTPCYVSDIANRLMGWTDLASTRLCVTPLHHVVEDSG